MAFTAEQANAELRKRAAQAELQRRQGTSLGMPQEPSGPTTTIGNILPVLGEKMYNQYQGVGTGAAKGLASTLKGVSNWDQKIEDKIREKAPIIGTGIDKLRSAMGVEGNPTRQFFQNTPDEALNPEGGYENLGYATEQLGEYALPSGLASKAQKSVQGSKAILKLATKGTGGKAAEWAINMGTRAATESSALAAITAIQNGELDDRTKQAATIGAVFPFAEKLVTAPLAIAGKGMKSLGVSSFNRIIKPLKKFKNDGYKRATIDKYKLEATSLQGVLDNAMTQIDDAYKAVVKETSQNKPASIGPVLQRIRKSVNKIKEKHPGAEAQVETVYDDIVESIASRTNGTMQTVLPKMQAFKQGLGNMGSFYGGGAKLNPDASLKQKVYNAAYHEFRTEIEGMANVSKNNKILNELMPVEKAINDRLFTQEKLNWFGVGDIGALTFGSLLEAVDKDNFSIAEPTTWLNNKAVATFMLYNATKNPKVAYGLTKAGRGLGTVGKSSLSPMGRLLGGKLANDPQK